MNRYHIWRVKATKKRNRVLISKPGLDGHDRGAKVIMMALRDAGMEVIYTGRHRTPQQIVSLAMKREVDVIGLSILSGAHIYLVGEVLRVLRESEMDIPVIVGGIIPEVDIPSLKEMGVAEVFPVGSKINDIVCYIKQLLGRT